MPKVSITNAARADRGVHSVDGLVMLAPGETRELDVPQGELDDLPDYLTVDGAPEPTEPEGDGLDGMAIAELDKIIADEGAKVPEMGTGNGGRVVKADKVAAIRAHREAAAKAADGLDDMDDATLRDTVQAITGAEPPADADRAALLALARGE